MYDHVESLKLKVNLRIKQLNEGNLVHFPTLKLMENIQSKFLKEYANLSNLLQQFDKRLLDFEKLQPHF